ncbi:MAG: helix-turn-helix transcriptional regulator [Thermoanaerobaculia bacterium]
MKKKAPALPIKNLGHILAVLRNALGFKQYQLARAARVHPSSLSDYENGISVPEMPTLQRLLEAMGVSFSALELTGKFLEDLEATGRPANDLLVPQRPGYVAPVEVGPLVAEYQKGSERLLTEFVSRLSLVLSKPGATPESATLQAAVSSEGDRVEGLWALVKRQPMARQRKLLQEDSRFWRHDLCERLCQESSRQAARHPNRALFLAEHAVFLAERISMERGDCPALRAFAAAHQANAIRAKGTLPMAAEAFEQVSLLWSEAVRKSQAPASYEARILDLKSSLCRASRNLPEAITLIDKALELAVNQTDRGRLLIQKSKIVEETGDYTSAIALLQEAEPFIDPKADPRNMLCLQHNLMWLLATEGKAEEAQALLPGVRTLSRKLNNALDLVRLRWAEARIEAGFGRTAKAMELLRQVRAEFATRRIDYDTALVTLELAVHLASDGQTAEVKTLARNLVPIFKAQQVHREALAALTLFRNAAEKESVTVELARSLLGYLQKARNDPSLRFEG